MRMRELMISESIRILLLLAVLIVAGIGSTAFATVSSRTYTTCANFAEGMQVGVECLTPPGSDGQLQLMTKPTTFPFIWIANSDEGTISKLDTRTGKELGRYRTGTENIADKLSPSRTTVDLEGNVWVGNRGLKDGAPAHVQGTVVKVGLLEAGNCVDRNGNGVIDTSTGGGDVKPWPEGAAIGEDECILLSINVGGINSIPRAMAIDADNNVWVGLWGEKRYLKLNGQTGTILQTIDVSPYTPYGAVVDDKGFLWSATQAGNSLLKINPATRTFTAIDLPHFSYGLGLDFLGNIWVSGWGAGNISKVRRSDGAILGTFPVPGGSYSRGVVVTADNDVWVANSGSNTVGRLRNDGTGVATIPVGAIPTGVAVDADGKVWVTNLDSNDASRINPANNAVDGTFPVGRKPYNYSDMTAMVARSITTRIGTWMIIHDSQAAGTTWRKVCWKSDEPSGTKVSARVRSGEHKAGFGGTGYVSVRNCVGFNIPKGRYLQLEVTLTTTTTGVTPVVYDVTITWTPVGPPKPPKDKEKIKKKIEDAIEEKEKIRDDKLPAIQELKDEIEGSKAILEEEIDDLKAAGGVIEKRCDRILRKIIEINQSLENISAALDEVEAQLDDINSLLEEALDKLAEDKFTEVEEILAEAVELLKNLIADKGEVLRERINISKRFFQIKKELRAMQKVNALSRNKFPVDEVKRAFVDFERKAYVFIGLALDVYDELREIKYKLTDARKLQAKIKIMSIPSATDAEPGEISTPFSVAEVRLYPNPVMHLNASYLKVTGIGIAAIKLEIFNLAGLKILEKEAGGDRLELKVINEAAAELLANGVYLYIVTVYGTNGGIVRSNVRKLVILR